MDRRKSRAELDEEEAAHALLVDLTSQAVAFISLKDLFGLTRLLTIHPEICVDFVHDPDKFPMHNAHLNKGDQILHMACRHGFTPAVDFIVCECRANVNHQSSAPYYETPLHLAAYSDMDEIVDILLAHGGMSKAVNYQGMNALMVACNAGSIATARKILTLDIVDNFDLVTKSGKTALYLASQTGLIEIVQTLWHRGANLISDCDGRTCLHVACIHNRLSVIEFLIKNGVPCGDVDSFTKTPFDYVEVPATRYRADVCKLEWEASGANSARKLRQSQRMCEQQRGENFNWFRPLESGPYCEENSAERKLFSIDFKQETDLQIASRLIRENSAKEAEERRSGIMMAARALREASHPPLYSPPFPPQQKKPPPAEKQKVKTFSYTLG
jgi:ankyrin repeat protein